jgi:hypothetical protein
MGTYSSYPEKLTPYPAFPTTLACKFNDENKYKKIWQEQASAVDQLLDTVIGYFRQYNWKLPVPDDILSVCFLALQLLRAEIFKSAGDIPGK